MEKGVKNPYQDLKQLLEGKPSSKKKAHVQHEESPSKEREESKSQDESMEDVAPRGRRAQRSPTPTKRKRSPHSPHHRESKREEKNSKKNKERKRSPSSPSSSPSSSLDESSGYSSQEKQRRGHQRSYDKVLAFIQQFDAAFGDEGFRESSKLRHVAIHFQKSARQWWASLRANGEAPKTWKALRSSIMKQFLASDAKDKVLTKWRSLKLSSYESIHKYADMFWDLHLKATIYKKIDFEEQKQQFCAGLPEDMNEYVNSQRPKSISAVIHHTMVAARINCQQGAKRNLKPMEAKDKQEYKGKNLSQSSSKGNSNNNKAKEKRVFKGKNKLTPKELECYGNKNKCFKCGEQGHSYCSCPQRNTRNEQPRASMVEAPKEDVHYKGSPLSYAWGKLREHDDFILFDPGSTHNFISLELATKREVQDFKMGDATKADGTFIGQDVSVTPLIGKLRLHIQGYVDKEDFFISPLKHEDVILGAPWFDCLAASIKFPERKISFNFREKDMYINAQESGSTIPLVNDQDFDKSIKTNGPERSHGETSKRGLSTEKGVKNPYQDLKQLLEGKPSSKKKAHVQHEESPSKEREEIKSQDESMEDVAPRGRRAQRSPTPKKRKRSPHSPHHRESKREEKNSKKKKERKRSPSSPSSSPSSSLDESSGYSSQEKQRRGHQRSYGAWKRFNKLKKFKEGGKNISFLTYDGIFGAIVKVLAFIQQLDAAFGDEGFRESSKLRHVAIHFQKSARQWWASLRANGEAPKTWKALRSSIMKQFLASDAKDKVLTKWRSLKLSPYESIHKYADKFWDLHLKVTIYKKIDFEEQKQQLCAGLPEDMNEYVNSQRPKSISAVIHHTMVAARIKFQQGAKRNLKPMEAKDKQEYKGKNLSQSSSKGNSNNNKAKEKRVFKGKNKLTPEELECYRNKNKCFKCGEQGHSYRSCPQRNTRNEQPRASMVEAPKEDVHYKGSPLSYAWGKLREHDAFILFDPGSTHNFISLELATKQGVQDFEMGDATKADGAFIGQDVSVTPLIGKLRLHIQGYVDKEDFFISPLKHEDVILGAPWFDCLATSIKFPERKISFKFKKKDMYINAQESEKKEEKIQNKPQASDKEEEKKANGEVKEEEEKENTSFEVTIDRQQQGQEAQGVDWQM
ncbi:hypothetical protein L7F22_003479 [Adiantum nelumboides]|nr:hypothetical protein [Adiantum nelumboides]